MNAFNSLPGKWYLLLLIAAFTVIIPFIFFGNEFEQWFSLEENIEWMSSIRSFAWFAGILILILDILMPVPGTLVMSSLGYVYGFWFGGLISTIGTFLSGYLAYMLCLRFGVRAARWLLTDKDYLAGVGFFQFRGPIVIVLTRWLPVLSEVGACMAGIAQMPLRKFLLALAAASLPLGFTFAWIGSMGKEWPAFVVVLNICAPLILWFLASKLLINERRGEVPA